MRLSVKIPKYDDALALLLEKATLIAKRHACTVSLNKREYKISFYGKYKETAYVDFMNWFNVYGS